MASAAGYRLLPHTADAAVAAWGATLEALFEQMATGMYAVMVENLDAVRETERRHIEVTAADRERLLVAWLLELLFLTDTERLVFGRFSVAVTDGRVLRADAYGERLDPRRHRAGAVVKAVTLHGLAITEDTEGMRAEVLFDV